MLQICKQLEHASVGRLDGATNSKFSFYQMESSNTGRNYSDLLFWHGIKKLKVANLFSCNLCNVYSTIDFQITWIYKNCNIQFTTMLRSFKIEFWEVLFIFFVINQKYIFHLLKSILYDRSLPPRVFRKEQWAFLAGIWRSVISNKKAFSSCRLWQKQSSMA